MGLKPGDHVAYFEIDSMLPADDPRYAELQKRGQRTVPVSNTITGEGREITGHVLKTARLRGVYSQGLVMPLSAIGVPEDTPVGTDVTLQANVWKFEELPPLKGGDMLALSTRHAPSPTLRECRILPRIGMKSDGLRGLRP